MHVAPFLRLVPPSPPPAAAIAPPPRPPPSSRDQDELYAARMGLLAAEPWSALAAGAAIGAASVALWAGVSIGVWRAWVELGVRRVLL